MLSKAPSTARVLPSPLGLLFLLLLLGVLAVGGCNTVSGMGEDISAAGRGIDQTSSATQEKMTGKERPQTQRDRDYQSGRY
ncbi:MAG TPA: entericidin A/B family lipoprotein [Magnetospirillum sp.]|nr:entericidin A/B family lipoprotein [Magnetospirillum sp.]